ncbi:MAG: hypothetical protein ACX93T_04280, partial [Bacteroidota bacterium]
HVAAPSGQDALVGDQEGGVASKRAAIVIQLQQSPPYPTVYGGYRAFGAQAWYDYFGVDVDTEPALPSDIVSILNEESPFMLDRETSPQRVGANHLLTLIPRYVKIPGGPYLPFTLNRLGALAEGRYFPNNEEGYQYYDRDVRTQFGTEYLDKPYWLLMTYDVLQGTRGKTYTEQRKMVEKYSSKGWVLPNILEAATSILVCYAQSGKRQECLFSEEPWTCTRCCTPNQLVGSQWTLAVGGFGPTGLVIGYDYVSEGDSYGVAGCRRFY